jgi:hypothetical protein
MATIRRAGTGRLGQGARLVWTVAEGAKGRRWRWTHTGDTGLSTVGLMELDTDGRLTKVELASPVGLLTLHPEASDTELHGNVATCEGMRHLRLRWSPTAQLIVEGAPLVAAAAAHRLARSVEPGGQRDLSVVVVEPAYTLREARAQVIRENEHRWRIDVVPRPHVRLAVDDDGLPVGLTDEASWPLETDEPVGGS